MKPEPATKTELTSAAATATRRVRFDTPGVKAIGPYLPTQAYDVPVAEAERLVKHKGFHYVDGAAPADTVHEEH